MSAPMQLGSGDTVATVEADDLRPQDTVADPVGDRVLADRLDALETERVLQRALELEAESLGQPHTITTVQLERIAKEIGMDPAFVHQALGEVRLEPVERSRFERLVIPGDLIEAAKLSGMSRAQAEVLIERWMTQHEGLVKRDILADGADWDVDRRWRSRILARSISGGNRISRVAGGDLTHRIHSMGDQEHMVVLQAQGRWPLLYTKLAMAFGSTASALVLLGAAVTDDLLLGLVAFSLLIGATVGFALAGARAWASAIRGALKRSLTGLVSSATTKRQGWLARFRRNQDS